MGSSSKEQERLNLLKKMDDDLEEFMTQLASKQKNFPRKEFDFNSWCEEIDKHPAFMNKYLKSQEIKNDAETSEVMLALNALKSSDPLSEAGDCKHEGNSYFKSKEYRKAIESYTLGIKLLCSDDILNSSLHLNRAICNKALGNLRSAFKDCIHARKYNKTNYKAILVGAECVLELGYAKKCLEWIRSSDINTLIVPKNYQQLIGHVNMKAKQMNAVIERDSRAGIRENISCQDTTKGIFEILKNRNLTLIPPITNEFDFDSHETTISGQNIALRIDESGSGLIWTLLLQFPQVGQVDLITDCSEFSKLGELLDDPLSQKADWDINHEFRRENIRLFIQSDKEEIIREVFFEDHFCEVLSFSTIKNLLPIIQVFTRDQGEINECWTSY